MTAIEHPLLDVNDLRTSFITEAGVVPAVDGVSLRIEQGQTVALVGESGCGKSVTALSIMRLIPQPPGKIVGGQVLLQTASGADPRPGDVCDSQKPTHAKRVRQPTAGATLPKDQARHGRTSRPWHPAGNTPDHDAVDLLQLSEKRMRKIRGNRIAMIFQEPMTSLNPVYTVGDQIVEAIELHQPLRGKEAWTAAVEMLSRVGIAAPNERAHDYPHLLSGGMLQRVMIAMALSCQPSLLIADEPTTALDVTVQMQILELLRDLQVQTGMSILLITHDFGVVAQIADYVYVMYAGRIVEHGPVSDVLAGPLHPYTQGLLRCVPRLSQSKRRLEVIPGSVPDPIDYPCGCRFHPRCRLSADGARSQGRTTVACTSQVADRVLKRCVEAYDDEPSGQPELKEVRPGHCVACWEVDCTPAAAPTAPSRGL